MTDPTKQTTPTRDEAVLRLRDYLLREACLRQQRGAAISERAANWLEEVNRRLDCGYRDSTVEAAKRQAREFQQYAAALHKEAEMFMAGLSAPAPVSGGVDAVAETARVLRASEELLVKTFGDPSDDPLTNKTAERLISRIRTLTGGGHV